MSGRVFLRRKSISFDVFFCFLTNNVFIKKQYVWTKHSLVSYAFFNSSVVSKPSRETYLLKFFSKSVEFWSLFWRFVSFDRHNSVGFFVDLELIGLGFRIRKITDTLYRFFWGYANYVYLFVPFDVLVEYLPEDRSIFFFGVSHSAVHGLTTYLMLLKKLSSYRVTGFVKPGKIIRLNSGKQR